MKTNWDSRPPATARVARRIWDLVTIERGEEPRELWHNWNGMVYGQQLSDADYGAWKVDGGVHGFGEDVEDYIRVMAGSRIGGMLLKDFLAKYNPKSLKRTNKKIGKFRAMKRRDNVSL